MIATEKKTQSYLVDDQSFFKVEKLTETIGMVYSGMGPDKRFVLLRLLDSKMCWEIGPWQDRGARAARVRMFV